MKRILIAAAMAFLTFPMISYADSVKPEVGRYQVVHGAYISTESGKNTRMEVMIMVDTVTGKTWQLRDLPMIITRGKVNMERTAWESISYEVGQTLSNDGIRMTEFSDTPQK